jgi:hypothetical protein
LTCCSVHGWSLNIAWALYVWQMVPMLNACDVENKLLRVSLGDDAQTVCLCLIIKVLFTSKVVKIIYIHPVQWKYWDITWSSISSGLSTNVAAKITFVPIAVARSLEPGAVITPLSDKVRQCPWRRIEEWQLRSKHSESLDYVEVTGQLHTSASLSVLWKLSGHCTQCRDPSDFFAFLFVFWLQAITKAHSLASWCGLKNLRQVGTTSPSQNTLFTSASKLFCLYGNTPLVYSCVAESPNSCDEEIH